MKAFRVNGEGNPAFGKKPVCCTRKIKSGQVVLVIINRSAPFGFQTQYAHKSCVLTALNAAGPEATERDFEVLRQTILDTGEVFPRV